MTPERLAEIRATAERERTVGRRTLAPILDELLEQVDRLTVVLDRFVSPNDPCRYDHHDYCQAHHLGERPCEHEVAKELLGWTDGARPATRAPAPTPAP